MNLLDESKADYQRQDICDNAGAKNDFSSVFVIFWNGRIPDQSILSFFRFKRRIADGLAKTFPQRHQTSAHPI